MLWLVTKKELKKERDKIKRSFKKRDLRFKELKNIIVSKKEIELMIKEEILKLRELRVLRVLTTPNPKTIEAIKETKTIIRKKAEKLLDIAEIRHEIGLLVKKDYSTSYIHNQIVEVKQLCKKSCFFKYLKEVRGLRKPTPHTPRTKLAN